MPYQPSIGSDLTRRRVSNAHVNTSLRRGAIHVNSADHFQVAEPADSGNPCLNCVNRRQTCVFDQTERRVVILERWGFTAKHLRALERRAVTTENLTVGVITRGSPVVQSTDFGEQNTETTAQTNYGTSSAGAGANVPNPSKEPEGPTGRRKLDLSGTWDFSHEALCCLKSEPDQASSCSIVGEKLSYDISFRDVPEFDHSTIQLHSKDYIAHLADVSSFHLNSTHYFFDCSGFKEELEKTFHTSSQTTRLWQVKLLLIVALGKLFLEKGASKSGPPGVTEFRQGVNALPSTILLSQDPITATEVLCLLSFYAQAADLHETSYLYIGQAARLTRLASFKRACRNSESSDSQRRCALSLLYTVYVLDRRHSAVIFETIGDLNEKVDIADQCEITSEDDLDSRVQISMSIANILTRVTKGN
ncbi:unnamed protein product [Clonostachys rhizophaga]|uniref:Transcription factor domain-containing protein n=1 Tax=Clonostachys rhizophaga TaxID=160324 RepID=A0A9N9VCD0_9HYPO|nr:unnamed protein product [Clonostachys rhizophaga]